jgi:hypothetical protein
MSLIPKVEFYFDKNRDILNIYNALNSPNRYGETIRLPSGILELSKIREYSEFSRLLEKYRSPIYQSGFIESYLKAVKDSWSKIEKEYFIRLEKITGIKFSKEKINVYVTTIGKCPYNPEESSFMICFFSNIVQTLREIGHEILHLHLHNHFFNEIENKVGLEKAHEIKEALTVLLNIEFKDLWFAEDEGYSSHKEIREFIINKWNEKKDFDSLLNDCVKLIIERRLNIK